MTRWLLCVGLVACRSEARPDDAAEGGAIGTEDSAGEEADGVDGGEAEAGGSSGGDRTPAFDLGGGAADDSGGCAGPDGEGEVQFSYLWAANSGYGTVSKIDTVEMTEVGRYYTAPEDLFGSPSRTSVSLSGNVAVANRFAEAGVTMIIADPEKCAGNHTSSGKDDVLAWGEDDCVAWNTPLAYDTLRPVQWSPGVWDQAACAFVDEKVWTTGARQAAQGSVVVTVLHGETGAVEEEVAIPELPVGTYGPYGAAFDPDGNYWFIMSGNDWNGAELVRVGADDLTYDIWATPDDFAPYGFTVDTTGRPWIVSSHRGGMVRFDPDTESFDRDPERLGIGIQEDDAGRVWVVGFPWSTPAVYAYDRDSMVFIERIDVPGVASPRGLSLDYFGNILVVGSSAAGRVDPVSRDVVLYDGLDSAYTYSDMTGWALKNVTFPPEG